MSPSTEDNDKGDDSSTSEYDVNDDEACITDAMKAEEYKIHQQTVKDENKEKIEVILNNTLFLALSTISSININLYNFSSFWERPLEGRIICKI